LRCAVPSCLRDASASASPRTCSSFLCCISTFAKTGRSGSRPPALPMPNFRTGRRGRQRDTQPVVVLGRGAEVFQAKVTGIVRRNWPPRDQFAETWRRCADDAPIGRTHRENVRASRLVCKNEVGWKIKPCAILGVHSHMPRKIRSAKMKVPVVERAGRIVGLINQDTNRNCRCK
jgi:hypothetical protein